MIKSRKIIFKVPEFPHLSETFIVAQIITAIKLGYEVKILVRKLIDINPNTSFGLIEEYGLLDKIIIQDYEIPSNRIVRVIKWIHILLLNFKDFNFILKYHKQQCEFSLTWLFEWSFYNKYNKVSIFHVQYGTNSNPLPNLKKAGFKPALIVTFHGHDAFFPINGYISNNGYYDNLFKYGNSITANTHYLGEKLLDLGCPRDKLIIIPVGVDTNFFTPSEVNNKCRKKLKLITIGRLNSVKGHGFCIEAVNILVQKGFDVSLNIIGEGVERKTMEALVRKYKLENHVFLKGSKSQHEIREALWQHDVYLLTGQATTSGARETQGLATIEAQACGLPVVVFDSGGVKYTLKDNSTGFICHESDVESVVENIIKFIKNPILKKEMGNEAVSFVNESFSQKVINEKWETIYNTLSHG